MDRKHYSTTPWESLALHAAQDTLARQSIRTSANPGNQCFLSTIFVECNRIGELLSFSLRTRDTFHSVFLREASREDISAMTL